MGVFYGQWCAGNTDYWGNRTNGRMISLGHNSGGGDLSERRRLLRHQRCQPRSQHCYVITKRICTAVVITASPFWTITRVEEGI